MEISKCINLTSLVLLVTAVAGFAAHHLYEQHLSSGYAPIFKAAMAGTTWEERDQYVHETRTAVRTDKDREVESKLEQMQWDGSNDNVSSTCRQLEFVQKQKFHQIGITAGAADEFEKASDAFNACDAADEKTKEVDATRLWDELRHTTGLPAN
jgi:hypothetical protein